MIKIVHLSLVWAFFVSFIVLGAEETQQETNKTDLDRLVAETHKASLALREQALRKTIAKDTAWPPGIWGDNLWCLSALYLNKKVDAANARLLKQATDYISLERDGKHASVPEEAEEGLWGMFWVTEYVRTLCLFHAKSPHFPGRLTTATEAALKEALWLWVSKESRIDDAGMDDLLLLLGTENHNLNRRPNYYLITALLQEDPAYHDRKLADGHTVAEHAAAYTKFLRAWPASRARTGLWVEVGSTTYQKYSWPALFNLHELAPDPEIRKQFGRLLDLAFIEEEQLSVHGRRGGGRSRAYPGANAFESYKNLLYASEGRAAGSSHSRVIETSRYQLPAEAILLRKHIFPAAGTFVICNRVLGGLENAKSDDASAQQLAADSALVNYAYRTPHYLLGSTLQNPALAMPDAKTGAPTLKYAGISRQNRTCGMLFDDSTSDEICSVDAVIEHGTGGRPQHSFWSVQHENVLLLQRIAPLGRSTMGSYNTDAIGIVFAGKALKKVEQGGWIFATNGKAYVGVKFLDGAYVWDEKQMTATPANFQKTTDSSRILLHAGDISREGTFEKFQTAVLANRLNVTPDKVDYQFGTANHLEAMRYDAKAAEHFALPLINGKPVDLHPAQTFQSPFLHANFGSDKISVSVGPLQRVLDFSEQGAGKEDDSNGDAATPKK